MTLQFDEFDSYIEKVEQYCIKEGITEDNFDEKLNDPKIENKMEAFFNKLEKIMKNLADGYNYMVLKDSYKKAIQKSKFNFVLDVMI